MSHQSTVNNPTDEKVQTLELDLGDLDLATLASMEDSALGSIIRELNEEDNDQPHSRHSSHSSYSTHGTAAW